MKIRKIYTHNNHQNEYLTFQNSQKTHQTKHRYLDSEDMANTS